MWLRTLSLVLTFTAATFGVLLVQNHQQTSQESPERSVAEKVVWAQEEEYWRLLKAENRERYLDLWDDRFVGWPRFETTPVQKDKITHFMSDRKVLDYKLEPLSVREYGGNVVIVLYRATIHSTDKTGANESTRPSRLLHTWMKAEHGWRIIGGMSAEDQTSALSPRSANNP